MTKKILFAIFILVFNYSNAQERRYIDSLFIVTNYLSEIDSTVKVKKWNGEHQFQKVSQLLEEGKVFQKKFPIWLKGAKKENRWHYNELINQLTLVTQTLALYKADLKSSNYKRPANVDDLIFFSTNIPILIRDITQYCKMTEEEILFNTKK